MGSGAGRHHRMQGPGRRPPRSPGHGAARRIANRRVVQRHEGPAPGRRRTHDGNAAQRMGSGGWRSGGHRSDALARWSREGRSASGVTRKDSAWSQRRACALQIVTGRNSRRRKGLKPSRRLSETTGPRSPCAFRIAFLTAGVTEREAACKPRGRISHTAHRRPDVTAAQRQSFTRYRSSSRALANVTADPVMPLSTPVCGAMERLRTRYRAHIELSCFCYRSAPARSASPAAASPPVRSTAAERTVTGVVTTTGVTARTGARRSRQRRRRGGHRRGRALGRRHRHERGRRNHGVRALSSGATGGGERSEPPGKRQREG